jgi:hypothetical protein
VHPVGADQVRGAEDRAGLPVLVLRAGGDALGVLLHRGDLRFVHEGDPGLAGPALQHLLHLVLRGEQDERVAGGQPGGVEPGGLEQRQPADGVPGGDDLVGDAAGVELLQHAGVHDQGPGQVAHLVRAALDEHDRQAGLGQVPGQQQPGRSRAHDQDVGVGGG